MLDRNDFLRLFQNARGQITSSGTDLEHNVTLLQLGLVHDRLRDTGVLENVLAEVGVELEDGVAPRRCRGRGRSLFAAALVRRLRLARGVTSGRLGFRHGWVFFWGGFWCKSLIYEEYESTQEKQV